MSSLPKKIKYFFFAISVLLFVFCAKNVSAANNVYYSVSPFGTGDIKTGNPTATISGGVMTLSVEQNGNIGQGDRITYDTNKIVYISAVNSATSFNVVTALGSTPNDEGSAVTVNSIAHEYASLADAETGFTDANHINNTNLVTADVVVNISCYYDHDDYTLDTNAVSFEDQITDATRYIRVYSPIGGEESINSQASTNGVWNANKYALSVHGGVNVLTVDNVDYFYIRNLQITETSSASPSMALIRIGATTAGNSITYVDRCILKNVNLSLGGGIHTSSASIVVSNTVIYLDGAPGSSSEGIFFNAPSGTGNIINTTIYNYDDGIEADSGVLNCTNCVVFGNNDDFDLPTSVTNCASDDGDGTNPQILDSSNNYENEFVDATNRNFNLVSNSSCIDNGTNTGAPLYDIIGRARPDSTAYDIGAFEYYPTCIWNGSVSTDWAIAGNWTDCEGTIPQANWSVIIDGGTSQPTIDLSLGSVTINSLLIGETNASVLTLADNLSNNFITTNGMTVGANGEIKVAGTQTSEVLDLTHLGSFTTLDYTASNTSAERIVRVYLRAGNTATPDATWTNSGNWTEFADNADISSLSGNRYAQYQIYLETISASGVPTETPSMQDISINYIAYFDKTLTSSIYNSNDSANTLANLAWDETLDTNTNIRFQMQTSVNGTDWSGWMGPDGEADTYFDDANTTYCSKVGDTVTCDIDEDEDLGDHTNDQYYQYKAYLISSNGLATPILNSVTVTYVVNANPELQNIPTAVPNSSGDVDIVYSVRDKDSETNSVTPSFQYSFNGGTSWTAITADCVEIADISDGKVSVAEPADPPEDTLYTPHTAVWDPSCEVGIGTNTYETDAQVRVTVDDEQAANNTASSNSIDFILDTSPPTFGANPILVDASISPSQLTLNASDDSTFYQIIAQGADQEECENNLNSETYTDEYNSSQTLELTNDPVVICVQFQDEYSNESIVSYTTTPETPTAFMIQDTSNLKGDIPEYRLFTAWQVVADTTPAFGKYEVFRSESEDSGYVSLDTDGVIPRTLNYYGDNTVEFETNYYYKVRYEDEDGNISFFTEPIHANANGTQDGGENGGGISTLPPEISNVTIPTATIYTNQATILWDTDEVSDSEVEYITVIGGDFSSAPSQGMATMCQDVGTLGQHEVTLTNLTPNTTYYLNIKSTDPDENIGEDMEEPNGYSFTTADGPAISNVVVSSVTNETANILWTTNINANSHVFYDDNTTDLDNELGSTTGLATPTTSHSIEITGLTSETTYYLYVESGIAKDTNAGEYYEFTTLANDQAPDEDGPIISEVEISNINYNSAVVRWSTNEAGNSLVNFSTDQNYEMTQGNIKEFSTSHEILLNGLNSVTTYYYEISSMDAENNISAQSFNPDDEEETPYTFTTLAPTEDTDQNGEGDQLTDIMSQIQDMIDQHFFSAQEIQDALAGLYSISISSSGPSVDVEDSTATISWTTNRPSVGKVYYWQDTDNQDTARSENEKITSSVTSHEIILKNLNANTKYNYYVESIGLLNESTTSANSSFSTENIPQISGISIENVTLNSADISWTTTNSVDSSVLQYGEDMNYSNEKKGETSSSLHKVNLTNLKTNTTYHLRVKGEDSDGQTLTSNDYSFTTTSLPIISNVQIKDITTETATINWQTNVKTDSRVEFKKDNQDQGTTNGKLEAVTDHSYQLTNLFPGTRYSFKVYSKDTFNNESSSEEQTFTTNEDLNPPIITNIKSDTTVFPGKETQIQTIISWNTDKNSNSVLAYRQGVQKDPTLDGQLKNKNVQKIENWKLVKKNEMTKNHLFVLTDLKSANLYQFKVVSWDKHDNFAISENFSLLTPTKKQSVLDLIIENFEITFGWMKKVGE